MHNSYKKKNTKTSVGCFHIWSVYNCRIVQSLNAPFTKTIFKLFLQHSELIQGAENNKS